MLLGDDTFKVADIRFPIRNFFYGIGITYGGKDTVRIANNEYVVTTGWRGSYVILNKASTDQRMPCLVLSFL
jgi:hypothetical protein